MADRYGIPYMGSKNKIAEWVVSHFPNKDNFYDLFCGGCAITHCAMEKRKFKNYFINDIKGEMPQLFMDCIEGKYKNEKRWISKDEFDRLKGAGDPYVDICFSFGNNWRKGYAYSKDIEPFKKAFHYAIMFDDYSLMYNDFGVDLTCLKNVKGDSYDKYLAAKQILSTDLNKKIQHLESYSRIQSLERLRQLTKLKNIGFTVNKSCGSYDEVYIKPNSVIYCDIPYKNTESYNEFEFDYDNFYNWCLNQDELVFISEYDMPNDFICIAEKEKTCQLSATNNALKSVERIFVPKHQYEIIKPKTLFDL